MDSLGRFDGRTSGPCGVIVSRDLLHFLFARNSSQDGECEFVVRDEDVENRPASAWLWRCKGAEAVRVTQELRVGLRSACILH